MNNNRYFPETNIKIKDVQSVQLEILLEFDRICKENDIKYQLFAGTLLGAIRHKGFIPWDDDIDVCMLREDYDQFVKVSSNNLKSKYFLQDYNSDKAYPFQFAKLRKNNTLYIENDLKDINIHHGIFIDIFPFDNIKQDELIGKMQIKCLNIINTINSCRFKERNYKARNNLYKFFRMCFYHILKIFPKRIIDNLTTKIACVFNENHTKSVGELSISTAKDLCSKFSMERKIFCNSIRWEFEGHIFPIPKKYDDVLSKNYGDYMTFPTLDKQIPHHKIIEINLGTTAND